MGGDHMAAPLAFLPIALFYSLHKGESAGI